MFDWVLNFVTSNACIMKFEMEQVSYELRLAKISNLLTRPIPSNALVMCSGLRDIIGCPSFKYLYK